jgi:hypothetical protein
MRTWEHAFEIIQSTTKPLAEEKKVNLKRDEQAQKIM